MKRFFNAIMAGRQAKANAEIARMLQRSEYKNENFNYVLDMVERGELQNSIR